MGYLFLWNTASKTSISLESIKKWFWCCNWCDARSVIHIANRCTVTTSLGDSANLFLCKWIEWKFRLRHRTNATEQLGKILINSEIDQINSLALIDHSLCTQGIIVSSHWLKRKKKEANFVQILHLETLILMSKTCLTQAENLLLLTEELWDQRQPMLS